MELSCDDILAELRRFFSRVCVLTIVAFPIFAGLLASDCSWALVIRPLLVKF